MKSSLLPIYPVLVWVRISHTQTTVSRNVGVLSVFKVYSSWDLGHSVHYSLGLQNSHGYVEKEFFFHLGLVYLLNCPVISCFQSEIHLDCAGALPQCAATCCDALALGQPCSLPVPLASTSWCKFIWGNAGTIRSKNCYKMKGFPSSSDHQLLVFFMFLQCIRCSGRMMCPCSPHEWSLKPPVFKTRNSSWENDVVYMPPVFFLYGWALRKQSLSKLLPKATARLPVATAHRQPCQSCNDPQLCEIKCLKCLSHENLECI